MQSSFVGGLQSLLNSAEARYGHLLGCSILYCAKVLSCHPFQHLFLSLAYRLLEKKKHPQLNFVSSTFKKVPGIC